jgi:hypothetical protein
MKKILMIALVLSSVISSCKKDKETTPAIDPRDKFVGTWKGNYSLQGLPQGFPTTIPTTIIISKSTTESGEISIKIDNTILSNQVATALFSGNQYIYKPLSAPFSGFTVTLNGTGTLSTDGKTITESGTINGASSIPNVPNLAGTWTSTLTKQ